MEFGIFLFAAYFSRLTASPAKFAGKTGSRKEYGDTSLLCNTIFKSFIYDS